MFRRSHHAEPQQPASGGAPAPAECGPAEVMDARCRPVPPTCCCNPGQACRCLEQMTETGRVNCGPARANLGGPQPLSGLRISLAELCVPVIS